MGEAVTKAYLERVFEQTKNWGRWGKGDERGALHYITEKKRAEAAALVRDGQAVSCARDFPTEPSAENPHPALHLMVAAGDDCTGAAPGLEATMDFLGVAFHGMATSHLDALCHVFVGGRMYNGFPGTDVKSTGARRCDVMAAGDGIVTRGVLLDLPAARGVPWLELGDRATPEDLEAAEKRQGVRVSEGDCLLVAHGRDARRAKLGPWSPPVDGLAGLDPTCIPWLHERRISVLGSDGVSDALPPLGIPDWPIPIHQCCLVGMGVPLLDNLDLSRLAAACAASRRWEFLLVVAPLRVRGGTGSPVNPVAIL
jgi:kynurenine formamidase